MLWRTDSSNTANEARNLVWHLKIIFLIQLSKLLVISITRTPFLLTDKVVLLAKEALPFDLEHGGIRPVGVLVIRFGISTNSNGTGVEVWVSLDVAIVDGPMLPSQNSSTPEKV